MNHPALRYGGYVLFFLLFAFPISLLISNKNLKFKNNIKSIKIIFIIVVVIFVSRNLNRLINENSIYNYNFVERPYYNIQDDFYTLQNNKKIFFKDISLCNYENSIKDLKCKRIMGYNFYFKEKN